MLFKFLFKCLLKLLFFAKTAYELAQKELRSNDILEKLGQGKSSQNGTASSQSASHQSLDTEWDKLQQTFQGMQQKLMGNTAPETSLEVNALRADIAALRAEIRALKNGSLPETTHSDSGVSTDDVS